MLAGNKFSHAELSCTPHPLQSVWDVDQVHQTLRPKFSGASLFYLKHSENNPGHWLSTVALVEIWFVPLISRQYFTKQYYPLSIFFFETNLHQKKKPSVSFQAAYAHLQLPHAACRPVLVSATLRKYKYNEYKKKLWFNQKKVILLC